MKLAKCRQRWARPRDLGSVAQCRALCAACSAKADTSRDGMGSGWTMKSLAEYFLTPRNGTWKDEFWRWLRCQQWSWLFSTGHGRLQTLRARSELVVSLCDFAARGHWK
eukprot:s422_g43.t1